MVLRKNSQSNRSERGAATQSVLMSVYRTLKLRGHDPFAVMVDALRGYLQTGELMPQPQTAYGQSKLQAEEIHRQWAEQTWGRLSIIRPGVVFGPGEGGNVTRLVDEMLKRQRAILLRPDLPKAGIYIEELLDLVHWLRVQDQSEQSYRLVNGVSHENLTFNAFGRVLATLRAPERRALNVPAALLRLPVTLLSPWAGLIPAGFKLHPERLAKLFRANEIHSATLADLGYPFGWPLERALADWLERGL